MIVGRDYRVVGHAEAFDPHQRRFKARAMTRTVLKDSVGFYDPDGADLTLLNEGRRPLLLDHERAVRSVVGVIEAAWVEADAVQVICRMGHGQAAEEAWQNIRAGIWTGVSLGNRITDLEPLPGGGYRVRAWQPHELSLVWSGWCPDAIIDDVPEERDFARIYAQAQQHRIRAQAKAAEAEQRSRGAITEGLRQRYQLIALELGAELGIEPQHAIAVANRVALKVGGQAEPASPA